MRKNLRSALLQFGGCRRGLWRAPPDSQTPVRLPHTHRRPPPPRGFLPPLSGHRFFICNCPDVCLPDISRAPVVRPPWKNRPETSNHHSLAHFRKRVLWPVVVGDPRLHWHPRPLRPGGGAHSRGSGLVASLDAGLSSCRPRPTGKILRRNAADPFDTRLKRRCPPARSQPHDLGDDECFSQRPSHENLRYGR